MKKKIVSGILASAIVIGGGTMAYVGYAQTNLPPSAELEQIVQRNIDENFKPAQMNIEEVSQKIEEVSQQEVELQKPVEKVEESVRPVQQKQWQVKPPESVEEARKFMEQQGVNVEQAQKVMEEQGIDIDEMYEVMSKGDFDQMREFMGNQNVQRPQVNFQGMRNFR